MSTILNFNPQAMTDQELLDKTTEIHKKLVWAQRFSCNGTLIDQLKTMADACAFEGNERASRRLFDALNKNRPDEKDITPDHSKKASDKTNGKEASTSVKRENVFRSNRSTKPVKE